VRFVKVFFTFLSFPALPKLRFDEILISALNAYLCRVQRLFLSSSLALLTDFAGSAALHDIFAKSFYEYLSATR